MFALHHLSRFIFGGPAKPQSVRIKIQPSHQTLGVGLRSSDSEFSNNVLPIIRHCYQFFRINPWRASGTPIHHVPGAGDPRPTHSVNRLQRISRKPIESRTNTHTHIFSQKFPPAGTSTKSQTASFQKNRTPFVAKSNPKLDPPQK